VHDDGGLEGDGQDAAQSTDAGNTPSDDAGERDDASIVEESVDDAGNGSIEDAAADAEPFENRSPTLTIDFPVSGVVDRAQIRVRGRVDDPDGDPLELTVEGAIAEIDDGVFTASVALTEGANEIDVEVTDGRGGEASASVSIERRTGLFASPFDLAVHAESNRAWVADYLVGVIEVDLETGARQVLDGLGTAGQASAPLGVAVAPDGSRVFASVASALDPESSQVLVRERALEGGAWTTVADLGPAESLQLPLRVDAVRNRLILATGTGALLAVDLAAGPSRGTVTSIASIDGATSVSSAWFDYRESSNELLGAFTEIGSQDGSLIRSVNLGTASVTPVWSSPASTDFVAASGVAFNGSSAYVADWARGTIHSMELSTGVLTSFSGAAGSGPQLMLPESMVLAGSTLYVIDSGLGALFSIFTSGGRTVETERGTGTGQGFFGPTGLTFDATGDRFLVMDSDPRAGLLAEGAIPSRASLVQVDRRTGNRRLISAEGTGSGALLPWGTSAAMHPSGVVLATTNRMGLLSSASGAGSLIEIDLASGDRRVISGANAAGEIIGTGPSLDSAIQVIVESETHALVLQSDKIVRVHLPTGNRTIISGPDGMDVQGSGPQLVDATGFVLDDRADPALAYVAAARTVIEVELDNGNRRTVSNDDDASSGPALGQPGGIVLDAARERLIVVMPEWLRQRDVFIEVSLEDGERRFLSPDDEASRATQPVIGSPPFEMVSGLHLDEEARVLWAIDWSLRSLQALDADTGEPVLFSHFGR
jgi:hypothetical protein